MVIPGLSFGGLLACCTVVSVPGCHVRREGRIGATVQGTMQRGDSPPAGWLAGFLSLSKTNNGHVTGRVLCLRADKPNLAKQATGKGWGNSIIESAQELERNNLDFPSPHARAE